MSDPREVKRAIVDAGLEVYRTGKGEVHLAERIRENLLMDAGVRIDFQRSMVVFCTRAQRSHHPSDSDDQLFERARTLGKVATDERGFAEIGSEAVRVDDPGGSGMAIDTWFEVSFERSYGDLPEALELARFLLGITRSAGDDD